MFTADSGLHEPAVRLLKECGVRKVPMTSAWEPNVDPSDTARFGSAENLCDCERVEKFVVPYKNHEHGCIVVQDDKKKFGKVVQTDWREDGMARIKMDDDATASWKFPWDLTELK